MLGEEVSMSWTQTHNDRIGETHLGHFGTLHVVCQQTETWRP